MAGKINFRHLRPQKCPTIIMASIQKTAKGYRAQIKKLGVRDSQVFPTRREAVEWAARRELEISMNKNTPEGERTTLRAVLRKYAEEMSPTKSGEARRNFTARRSASASSFSALHG